VIDRGLADGRAQRGRQAEDLAAEHLEARGCVILARNWRRPEGELDLVVDDQGVCVFVEVRSRTGDEYGHPLETVDRRKRARVIRAARLYLDAEPTRASGYRFDVVGIVFPADGGEPTCMHVEDAFHAER
jgi:putative endonuclease